MTENHSDKEILIVKHLTGEITTAEEQILQEWIAMDNENETLFQTFKKAYELSGAHYTPNQDKNLKIDINQEWAYFNKQIANRDKNEIPLNSVQNTRSVILKIAAAVLLVIATGIAINYYSASGDQVYQTADSNKKITLPDGSIVSLNRNSTLSYTKSFGDDHRKVALSGEGFFEVKPDKQNPFTILVDDMVITVVGTSFNVQGYNSGKDLEVTVETGVVRLKSTKINEPLDLKAGEKGIYKKTELKLIAKRNDDSNFLAWKTRRIVFEGNNLSTVAETLQSVYGVEIIITATEIDACKVTATFDNQSLEAVLAVLKSTLNLTYRIDGNKIEIIKVGC